MKHIMKILHFYASQGNIIAENIIKKVDEEMTPFERKYIKKLVDEYESSCVA